MLPFPRRQQYIYSTRCMSKFSFQVWVLGNCLLMHHQVFSMMFVHAPVCGSVKNISQNLIFRTSLMFYFVSFILVFRIRVRARVRVTFRVHGTYGIIFPIQSYLRNSRNG